MRSELLELGLWREACRHIEIGEAVDRFAALIGEALPLHEFLVLRLDPGHSRVITVASAPAHPESRESAIVQLSATDFKLLRTWVAKSAVTSIRRSARLPKQLSALGLSLWRDHDVLIVTLAGEHGSLGVGIFVAQADKQLSARHEDLARIIREPLSVALDNDQRLHELAALREAAEADKRSLLTRLGRSEVGDTIVGESSGLRLVMERVRLVERSDVPVLILGETGTGKEMVARAIHHGGDRRSAPFIRVNCGAIPRELIDSQLFGHEKGSFTGATDSRPGWFERADQGTLFLDEIGELPLDAQVRLLRVLQDGIVERIGGHRPVHVDVRLVAATHRDLAQMVRDSAFREDLWYRIAVFPILLPPLRERQEDIPALVEHFCRRAAARFGLAKVSPDRQDLETLVAYSWPGNIRELGAVIDRAAILGDGRTLEVKAALGLSVSSLPQPGATRVEQFSGTSSLVTLDEAMRAHIVRALQSSRGQIEGRGGAAEILAINPHTLRARMRKLGIVWREFRHPSPR